MEDRVLAGLAEDRLDVAATAIVEGYGPDIYSFIAGVLHDADAAGEVFSVFCEDMWRGIGRFEGRSSIRTWLYTLARHACFRHLRDPYARRGRPFETGELSKVAQDVRTRTESFLRTHMREGLKRIRSRLSPEERTLLILHVDRGLSLKDTASVMSSDGEPVSHAAIRKRFQRLKEKIKELSREEGLVRDR